MEAIFLEVLKQGGFAAVAVIVLLLYFRKEKECQNYRAQICQLYEKLEKKTEKYMEQMTRLQNQMHRTISALIESEEDD